MTNTEYLALVQSAQLAAKKTDLWTQFPEIDICDLDEVFDATHRTIKDIAAQAGMSVRQLGLHFAIPRRTIGDWSADVASPPIHELLLIQEALGLLDVRRK